MKRLLFVDDNDMLREMYALMMAGDDHQWEAATAADAQEALALMERNAFDVVLSDMRMPGMSGIEFLTEVRKRHPGVSRIIVSGIGDQEEVARSLDSTHQFIPKPVRPATLKATLARICGLDNYLKDEKLKSLVGKLRSLPSFPTLYLEIMKAVESPDATIDNVAEIIRQDPSMTARILQIANSAALGLPGKTHNTFDAVQQLGMNTVRSLTLSAHVFSRFAPPTIAGFSPPALWDHLMKTGALAKRIMLAENAEAAEADDALAAGLLHDAGKMMLAENLPAQFQNALSLAEREKIEPHEAELKIFGATHAGIAGYLLGLWGLPASIVEAVALHHDPSRSELSSFTPLTAVHVANALLAPPSSTMNRPKPDRGYLAAIGMSHRLGVWKDEAARFLNDGN